MRLLEQLITEITTGSLQAIDVAARGAHAFDLELQKRTAGATGQISIDDRITTPTWGIITRRLAAWFYDDLDSQQGSYIRSPLLGDILQISNGTAYTLGTIINLYDLIPTEAHGAYTKFHRTETIAAGATFTSGDMANGVFGASYWMLQTDQEADIFIDHKVGVAGTYITTNSANIAGATGGVTSFTMQVRSPVYRVRIRNNDGANPMLYTVSAYCQGRAN